MSFYFFWIISASFTDKLVLTLNNGEIIYFGGKAVKCIQLYCLHHQGNYQLGLYLTYYCWGGGRKNYRVGHHPGCTVRGTAELSVWEHRHARLFLVTGNGAFLITVTYKWAEKSGYRDLTPFPDLIIIFFINWWYFSFMFFPLHSTDHFSTLLKNMQWLPLGLLEEPKSFLWPQALPFLSGLCLPLQPQLVWFAPSTPSPLKLSLPLFQPQ